MLGINNQLWNRIIKIRDLVVIYKSNGIAIHDKAFKFSTLHVNSREFTQNHYANTHNHDNSRKFKICN
jgi:hypothetical protein